MMIPITQRTMLMKLVEMTDEELLARLRNEEDNFIERKTVSDLNDCVKTVVAFANSAPIDMPCVLYVGVKKDGSFEEKTIDFDSIQKSVNNKLKSIYPRVPYISKVITDGTKQVLAVVVPGSELRPHFAGPSYIRVGSESEEASRAQLDNLIAQRDSKVYRLSQNIDKEVMISVRHFHADGSYRSGFRGQVWRVIECNESWVSLRNPGNGAIQSFPLKDVVLNYDRESNRLAIYVTVIPH
jgi:hypothetical protein